MTNFEVALACFGIIVLLATYWTVWKIRGDLIEGREKLKSELSEIRKSLESKTGGA